MIENLPGYISITFILTTFLTIGFLIHAVRKTVLQTTPAKILITIIPFWLFFTATMALGGFYAFTGSAPPRVFLFGAFPAFLVIVFFFIFFRKNFVDRLPLRTLTLLSVIRIPVEIVLLWLFQQGAISRLMTFEGFNFDILSGLSAPLIYWLAFRENKINRPLLIGWNIGALILLIIIVSIAAVALPSPMQQIAFDQPNRAVMYFPYIWLPAIVVPIVLFSHLVSLKQLLFSRSSSETG
ncbi:MAG: hypothetical protein R2747_05660 [Pyrinomonadaceae bacterium]